LKSYASWLKSRPISDQAAREFLLELRDQGFANATIRFYYHALKPLLLTQGINLSLKFKKRTKLPPYHSVNQVKAILSTVENRSGKWSQLADRDWLMIAILAYTGIRRGELLALRPRDIDLFAKTIRIQGKGDKERIIPIHQLLYKPLKFYTASMPPHHYLFPFKPKRAWQIVVNYARQAGIPDFHPHAFRHFFATQLVEQGVSLHIIKELLGHADISTTAIYLDVLPKHLENAVHTLPDLSQEGEKR
jgi:integrase/recombinase XerD